MLRSYIVTMKTPVRYYDVFVSAENQDEAMRIAQEERGGEAIEARENV